MADKPSARKAIERGEIVGKYIFLCCVEISFEKAVKLSRGIFLENELNTF